MLTKHWDTLDEALAHLVRLEAAGYTVIYLSGTTVYYFYSL